MSRFVSASGVAVLGLAAMFGAMDALAAPSASTPDFSGAWVSDNEFGLHQPPSGPGPIGDLEGYLHVRRGVDAQGRDTPTTPWIGNYKSPMLTPWAANILKGEAENAIRTGKDPFWAASVCWPGGVPVVVWAEPSFFLQTPGEVTILYQRDHQVRHVYMNTPHTKNPKPSWYGESVGHYEGDTLVVDTIGFNDKTFVDRYGTPHSDKLHVVERYRVLPDKKTLEGTLTFEDPKAYTMKWSASVKYHRTGAMAQESICAEDTFDFFTGKLFPIPVADGADF